MAGPPSFERLEIQFQTGNEDKDADTKLLLFVSRENGWEGSLARLAIGDIGTDFQPLVPNQGFPNQSLSPVYTLQPRLGGFTQSDLPGLDLVVQYWPNGSDTWDFKWYTTLYFSDGSHGYFVSDWVSLFSGQPLVWVDLRYTTIVEPKWSFQALGHRLQVAPHGDPTKGPRCMVRQD